MPDISRIDPMTEVLRTAAMFSDEQRLQLAQGASEWGLGLTETMLDRFARFATLLHEANVQFNLTRIKPEDVVPLHFLDSLLLAAVAPPAKGMSLLDVGAGAGFPGLPLAMAYPEVKVTLLDSTRKRLNFVESVVRALGLSNVETLHGRAEDLGRDTRWRERYDIVTARAVANMTTLAGWMLPFVRPEGLAAAYKSREVSVEIEAARPEIGVYGGRIERNADVSLPGTDIVRKIILIRKVRSTPRRPLRKIRTEP